MLRGIRHSPWSAGSCLVLRAPEELQIVAAGIKIVRSHRFPACGAVQATRFFPTRDPGSERITRSWRLLPVSDLIHRAETSLLQHMDQHTAAHHTADS